MGIWTINWVWSLRGWSSENFDFIALLEKRAVGNPDRWSVDICRWQVDGLTVLPPPVVWKKSWNLTEKAPENRQSHKERILFQSSIFRFQLLNFGGVSFLFFLFELWKLDKMIPFDDYYLLKWLAQPTGFRSPGWKTRNLETMEMDMSIDCNLGAMSERICRFNSLFAPFGIYG